MLAFYGEGQDKSIVVKWETASETGNMGFNLYRRLMPDSGMKFTDADTLFKKLNKNLIKGCGTCADAKAYTFYDKRLLNGMQYEYRLLSKDYHGILEEKGRMVARRPVASQGERSVGRSE